MKHILIFIFISTNFLVYSQEINLSKEFLWPENENMNSALIEKFIDLTPQEFQNYRLNEPYSLTISDLTKALHIIDLNNDGLDDIIFDGLSGGEPRQISIFINNGHSFDKVFTDYQQISSLKFDQGVLSEIQIKDWACCDGFTETYRLYDVSYIKGAFKFIFIESFMYLDNTTLPEFYWTERKKIKVLNDKYNIRFSPQIDDSTEVYYDWRPTYGNTVGKLEKNTIACAISESTDLTGRIWFFVAIYPEYDIQESYLFNHKDEIRSYKCGWISSRFVEIQE